MKTLLECSPGLLRSYLSHGSALVGNSREQVTIVLRRDTAPTHEVVGLVGRRRGHDCGKVDAGYRGGVPD